MKPKENIFGQAQLFVRQGVSLENNFPKGIQSVALIFACSCFVKFCFYFVGTEKFSSFIRRKKMWPPPLNWARQLIVQCITF